MSIGFIRNFCKITVKCNDTYQKLNYLLGVAI